MCVTYRIQLRQSSQGLNCSVERAKKIQVEKRCRCEVLAREEIEMDIELVKCECCGLKEDCTQDYISQVKAKFDGKWLCGLCSEAVRDEVDRGNKSSGMEEAVKAHMSFCRKYKSNPAIQVADGMRQMLRRRSGDTSSSPSSSKKYTRSASTSQVGDKSSFSYD
ncbi:hypothetical protein F0562_034985 [Nyssa sinensis]|uniref:DUF1677 domain-containing protein n=1 Tax=Nyssa sinensis TaxID=561372 RepID=A0A5J5AAQ5_9ASTE|nr:hypothetical protein F0562_034985 [Nyssa sinensis]